MSDAEPENRGTRHGERGKLAGVIPSPAHIRPRIYGSAAPKNVCVVLSRKISSIQRGA